MLELTKRADYALRLMIEVAASDESPVSTATVAKREDIPYQYLRKVAQQMVSAGLLVATRGKNGGLSLAHPAQTITLLEIVRVADEPALSKCLVDPASCTRRSRCVVFPVWRRLQREVERAMEAIVLSDLAEHHRAMGINAENGPAVRMSRKGESKRPILTGRTAHTLLKR